MEETFYLTSEKEMENWINVIKKAIGESNDKIIINEGTDQAKEIYIDWLDKLT